MEKENIKANKTHKGLIIGIVAAVVVIAIAIGAWIFYSSSMGYVAKVGDQKVTKQEYLVFSKFNMKQFLSNVGITSADTTKYDWNTKVNGETAKDQVRKTALDNIQEIKIQLIKAKEAGISLNKDDLTKIDDNINSQVTNYGGQAQAEQTFKSEFGVSLSEYKEIYKELYLTNKYMTSLYQKVTISDDEAKKQYDDNKADYDKITATHILLATVDLKTGASLSEGKKAEAKKKAEDLLAKVKAGEDISQLAVKNSEDTSVSENKGELTFGKGEMVSQFEDFCFTHKVGDIGLVESQYGYHVIKIQKRVEQKFDDVKASIKTKLAQDKFSAESNKMMGEWKKDSKFAVVKNQQVIDKLDKTLYQ